jgi:hypothetical protein
MRQRKLPKSGSTPPLKGEEIVRLEDLSPRADVKGGGRKRLFGQEPTPVTRRKRGGR